MPLRGIQKAGSELLAILNFKLIVLNVRFERKADNYEIVGP